MKNAKRAGAKQRPLFHRPWAPSGSSPGISGASSSPSSRRYGPPPTSSSPAGYSSLALGIFYQVIDTWKIRAWTLPFRWIGSNALAIYVVGSMVRFDGIARLLVGDAIFDQPGGLGALSTTTVNLGCVLLLAALLHRNKIFIRV